MAELGQVGFYTPQDLYYYVTDNRPLQDLQDNVKLVATQLDELWGLSQAIPVSDTGIIPNSVVITTEGLNSDIPQNGQIFAVTIANTCTGPTTLTLNGSVSGAVLSNGSQLEGGELVGGSTVLILYDSGNWLLFYQNSATFQINDSLNANNLISRNQLTTGALDGSFSAANVGSVTVSGAASFSSTLSISPGISGGNLVNLGQIQSGFGEQASLINWTEVNSDTLLYPGQTAFYEYQNMTSANMPLNISCGDLQLYEITIVYLSYLAYNLILGLMPNNNTYSNQFGFVSMETSYTNQNQFYAPASASSQYGFAVYSGMGDSFIFDSVYGAGSLPPFIRTLKVWTGVTSTSPIQYPTVTAYGGGGVFGVSSTEVPGVNIDTSTWQGNTGTPWTSLGTLVQQSYASGDTYSNLVLVKRLA